MRATDNRAARECELRREIVEDIKCGSNAYVGNAMAVKVAGEEVIVIARSIASLNIVFNYVEAKRSRGNADLMETLRTTACPEVAVVSKDSLTFDDEL